ncbi:MAG: ubiquitin C-terminal hydrolase [Lasallia pustulata]|uniref:ubiquitinyl hydrolase 1 n=1 Tax=Lasallia pustulata TaxID=136370 RepID=A0A5M8PS28_9LECA|nr:MAG: ubiquitin C-terminal hydrolase [Lasallia pustulata]
MSGSDNVGGDSRMAQPADPRAQGGSLLPDRSSTSATKRRASDMGRANTGMQGEDVEMVGSQSADLPTVPATANTVLDATPPIQVGSAQNPEARHNREVSVDMLAYDQGVSSKTSSKTTASETVSESTSSAAYMTPHSGIPSSNSLNGAPEVLDASERQAVVSAPDLPPIDEQIKRVKDLASVPMQAGQKGYVVSMKWLSRVLSRGSHDNGKDTYGKEAKEGPIGPVDNTGLNVIRDPLFGDFEDEAGEPYIPLRPGLQLPEDFEIVPQEAWELIIKWYGLSKGSPIITRYIHNTSTGAMENLQYEIHPPVFTILKLPDSHGTGTTVQALKEKQRDAIPVRVLASRHEGFQHFLKRVKAMAGIELKTKVRIWRILAGLGTGPSSGMITPAQSRSASPAPNVIVPVDPGNRLVLDVHSFAALQVGSQREMLDARDETANVYYNGHMNLDLVGLRQDEVIVLEEQIGGPAGGEWVSDAVGKQLSKNNVPINLTKSGTSTGPDKLKPGSFTAGGRASPTPGSSGMITRGRQQKTGKARGTVGLNNLGNTCYMNSALQCVRSVEELTQYFLMEKYKAELNPGNPLSHNGNVAKAYASLLHELYSENAVSSFAPRNLKNTIGKYGPSFSGYGQQDSQEFLLFLLDGLQEDLNRIHKKPYIEKPDSTDQMVHDPLALREMADKCWDIYKARNDSVITDLFAGMYKSTVVCPVCDKVSIIFDPFNNLTLQLPIENVWTKQIFFFPLNSRPIQVRVEINKNASFMALKEYICKRTKVDPKRTVLAEIYKNRIYKMFDDNASISDERIQDGDSIALYEVEDVPSNYPPPKKKGQKIRSMLYTSYSNSDEEEDVPEGDSPLAEKMLIAVFNRQIKDGGHSRYQQRALVGVPFYVIITRDEAKDYDAILRKILAKIATMTSLDILGDENSSDTESTQHEDSDTVLMARDDGDSSSDSKVQARSVESEDGMVDISMRDAGEKSDGVPHLSSPPENCGKRRTPHVLEPGAFIKPELRTLFDMKYFSGTEMIPTGWSTLNDENKNYPSIASRIPQPVAQPISRPMANKLARRLQGNASSSSSDEDVDDLPPLVGNNALINPGSDSDSDGLPLVEELHQPVQGFNAPGFSKHFPVDADLQASEPGSNTESTPLIRLGEAIVLDWDTQTFESLFSVSERDNDNDMRGSATWDNVPLMPDPELENKRQLRLSRKKNGVSLDDCLDEFGRPEILSENDAWYCPRCKEHRRASKTFELWKSPDILVVHLKRFSAQGRLRDKLDVFVDFPVEGLDLSSRVAMQEDGKSPIYDLFAVDNHYGGLGGGHYTAFAKNFYDNNWYEYNDSSVSRRPNPQAVVTSAAYLLFYRRRSPQPLGGPFFEKIISAASSLDSEPQPDSRATSPAGEGKRLGDFSRNGSSSALLGVGAAHQAGSGGLADDELQARNVANADDVLPGYSMDLRAGEQTLESMEMDEESGAGIHSSLGTSFGPTNWSFAGLPNGDGEHGMAGISQVTVLPPGSDQGDDEDLFDGASNKAASSAGLSDDEGTRILTDFADDAGTTHGAFGTPLISREGTPVQEVPPALEMVESDNEPAAEVRLHEDVFEME